MGEAGKLLTLLCIPARAALQQLFDPLHFVHFSPPKSKFHIRTGHRLYLSFQKSSDNANNCKTLLELNHAIIVTLLFTICLRKSFSDIVLWQNSQDAGSQPFSLLFTNTACTQRSKSRAWEPLGSTLTNFSCLQYFTQPALSPSLYGESSQNLTSKSSHIPSSPPLFLSFHLIVQIKC